MRVAIFDSQVPFFHGGAEMLASRLADGVRALGHDVEVVRLPFNPASPAGIARAMDFSGGEDASGWIAPPDVAIALRFPAYLVQHPDKRVWLLHQLRQYYEYYEQTRTAGNSAATDVLRGRIVEADRAAMQGASAVWALSRRVADRLAQYNGVQAPPPLYSPLPEDQGFYTGRQDRYVLAPSRMEPHKRQWLLIEAMRHVKADVKAVVVGDGGSFAEYRERIERAGLQERVLLCGHVSRAIQAAWYANCLAVFFGPHDEDYGYVTLEAMLSGKPVITCRDSGGTLEFVEDRANGLVVDPRPEAVAAAIEALAAEPARARAMGMEGRERYRRLDLTWERTAALLLEGRKTK